MFLRFHYILGMKSMLNPPFRWDQFNPDFFDQSDPNPTKKFWKTQTKGLIWIKTKIGLLDLIWLYNPFFLLKNTFSRFDPIRYPKSQWITFEKPGPGFQPNLGKMSGGLAPIRQSSTTVPALESKEVVKLLYFQFNIILKLYSHKY